MAKKSMIAREEKRARTVAKYAAKRAQLKEIVTSASSLMRRNGMRRSRSRSCPAIRALSDSGVAAR